ncbi:MAG TPA: hypothetical protein VHA55_08975 [Pseudorhodoplanes sp.]|nr:hypothetical protein [Pseudorhodoplanes sp.]
MIATVIREPAAQLMSLLWHLHAYETGRVVGRTHPHASESTHRDLLRWAMRCRYRRQGLQSKWFILDDQAWRRYRYPNDIAPVCLSAAEGLARCHIVGVSERLRDTLRLVAWRMRLPAPRDVPHARNTTAGTLPMSDSIRTLLRDHLACDTELYGRAYSRFAKDYAALVAEAGGETSIDRYLDGRAMLPR